VNITLTLAIPGGHRTLHVSRSGTSQLRNLRASRDINITSTYIVIYVLHVRYVRTRRPICFSEIDVALKRKNGRWTEVAAREKEGLLEYWWSACSNAIKSFYTRSQLKCGRQVEQTTGGAKEYIDYMHAFH